MKGYRRHAVFNDFLLTNEDKVFFFYEILSNDDSETSQLKHAVIDLETILNEGMEEKIKDCKSLLDLLDASCSL